MYSVDTRFMIKVHAEVVDPQSETRETTNDFYFVFNTRSQHVPRIIPKSYAGMLKRFFRSLVSFSMLAPIPCCTSYGRHKYVNRTLSQPVCGTIWFGLPKVGNYVISQGPKSTHRAQALMKVCVVLRFQKIMLVTDSVKHTVLCHLDLLLCVWLICLSFSVVSVVVIFEKTNVPVYKCLALKFNISIFCFRIYAVPRWKTPLRWLNMLTLVNNPRWTFDQPVFVERTLLRFLIFNLILFYFLNSGSDINDTEQLPLYCFEKQLVINGQFISWINW